MYATAEPSGEGAACDEFTYGSLTTLIGVPPAISTRSTSPKYEMLCELDVK